MVLILKILEYKILYLVEDEDGVTEYGIAQPGYQLCNEFILNFASFLRENLYLIL